MALSVYLRKSFKSQFAGCWGHYTTCL